MLKTMLNKASLKASSFSVQSKDRISQYFVDFLICLVFVRSMSTQTDSRLQ
jgi:hypothetical protein